MLDLENILSKCEESGNKTIYESFIKAYPKINGKRKIVCSISGGSDSDIMLDIITKIDTEKKVKYIFFNTGIEYEATKKHLDYLENKYGIVIERIKAVVPVPLGCKKYGLPFWSKFVSEMVERLQRYDFKWEDKSFEELLKEYPKCKVALKWWCNLNGDKSRFNIEYIKGLKEFIIENPPKFKISNKCCKGAKKDNAHIYLNLYEADLNLVGIRKSEGGIRSAAYKSCFDNAKENETWDNFRPIFWFSDKDKEDYVELFKIRHSACYTHYGLKRTGCAGCPFGKEFENELDICRMFEPNLYKAVNNIFGQSYEYTRNFLKFRRQRK